MGKVVNLSVAVPIRSGDPGANQISRNLSLLLLLLLPFRMERREEG